MNEKIGQCARPAGGTSEYNWLSTQSAPYGSSQFANTLAGKLAEMGDAGSSTSSVMGLHYQNVTLAYAHQYGLDVEGDGANAAVVTRSGQEGSETELRIPATAAQMQKAWNIIVGPELTWSAVPSTTDFASEAKAITARNALAYYWTHEAAGAVSRSVALDALFYAEGVMHIPWDKSLGTDVSVDETDPANPVVTRSGDMRFTPIPTWDTLRDRSARSFEQQQYTVVREWQNKYDRAALCEAAALDALKPDATEEEVAEALQQAREKAAKCRAAPSTTSIGQSWAPLQERYDSTSDFIPVYYLYAKRSPSVQSGRQTVFLEDGTLLEDGPLDEAYVMQLPVVRMSAGEYRGTPWPYSKFFACLGAGQAADALYAALLTNATAVSGCVISTEDDNVDGAEAIALNGGPQVVVRPKGSKAPEVLQLHSASPDHFNLIAKLRNENQQIIGLDALTAGQEIGANLSGAAMVMMTSTSVQNNSQLQASWRDFVQATGNVALRHIQYHMTEPKRIALAGNSRASLVSTTEISRDQVEGIERVTVSIGSALQQTDAGKYEIASTALEKGWAQTPEQFQMVLDTGRLDALTQDLSNELLLITSENEALGKAEQLPVTPYENHVLHIKLHRSVLSSLTARRQPGVIDAVRAHMDEHVAALQNTNPFILEMLNQPTLAPQGGAMPPGTPPPGLKAPKELPPGVMPNGVAPSGANAAPEGVPKPQAPKNPQTGRPQGPLAGTRPPAMELGDAAAA